MQLNIHELPVYKKWRFHTCCTAHLHWPPPLPHCKGDASTFQQQNTKHVMQLSLTITVNISPSLQMSTIHHNTYGTLKKGEKKQTRLNWIYKRIKGLQSWIRAKYLLFVKNLNVKGTRRHFLKLEKLECAKTKKYILLT